MPVQNAKLPDMAQQLYHNTLANYAQHVQSKGYYFTTDWFGLNTPVWEHFLSGFANVPELSGQSRPDGSGVAKTICSAASRIYEV